MTSTDQKKATVTTPGDKEIAVERVFDAPRELVFKAFTDPELIPQWWGRDVSTTVVEALDARPGGEWRFVSHEDDGTTMTFFGEFREIEAPERIVWTFSFDGNPGEPMVETMTLEELGEQTLIKAVSVFATTEDRDGMIDAGMEKGMNESYVALDALLEKLKTA